MTKITRETPCVSALMRGMELRSRKESGCLEEARVKRKRILGTRKRAAPGPKSLGNH